jgi:dephospho-CoA kinase
MTPLTPSKAVLHLGLTGGIGSGKSTVAQMLVQGGAALVDADAIARQVTEPGGAAIDAIADQFGAQFIRPDGAMNRDAIRALVFSDPHAKKNLEAIIHPLVAQETQRQALDAAHHGHQTVVFDVPLLVESDRWRAKVDRILVVDCSVETQIQRVCNRNNWTAEVVQSIIKTQARREQRLAAADWVIFNQGISFEQLREKLADLPL